MLRRITAVAAVVVTLAVAGCATTRGYERLLDSWTGSDVNRLIQNWGAPAETYTMPDGATMYTWFFDDGAVAMPIGNMAYAVRRYCKTTFMVSAYGIIERWRYEGNTCRAE